MSDLINEQVDGRTEDPSIVDGVRSELEEIDGTDLSEHAARF